MWSGDTRRRRKNVQFPFTNGIGVHPLFANRNESIREAGGKCEEKVENGGGREAEEGGIDLCLPVIACFILIRVHTVAAVTSSNVSSLIKARCATAKSIFPRPFRPFHPSSFSSNYLSGFAYVLRSCRLLGCSFLLPGHKVEK